MVGGPARAICVHTNEHLRVVDVLTGEWSSDLQLSKRKLELVGAMGLLRNTTSKFEGGVLHDYEWDPSSPGLDFRGFIAVACSQDAVWILRNGHQLSKVDLLMKAVVGETLLEGEYVRCAAVDPECRSLVIGDCSGRIQILHLDRIESSFGSSTILDEAGDEDISPAAEVTRESVSPDQTGSAGISGGIALTPNGEFCVSVHNDGQMRFWTSLDGELQWAEKGNWMHVVGVELNASGSRLVLRWGGYSPKERVRCYAIDWNVKSLTEVDLGEGESSLGEAARIAFSGCGTQIAMVTEYSEVVVRDTKLGGERLVSFQ